MRRMATPKSQDDGKIFSLFIVFMMMVFSTVSFSAFAPQIGLGVCARRSSAHSSWPRVAFVTAVNVNAFQSAIAELPFARIKRLKTRHSLGFLRRFQRLLFVSESIFMSAMIEQLCARNDNDRPSCERSLGFDFASQRGRPEQMQASRVDTHSANLLWYVERQVTKYYRARVLSDRGDVVKKCQNARNLIYKRSICRMKYFLLLLLLRLRRSFASPNERTHILGSYIFMQHNRRPKCNKYC